MFLFWSSSAHPDDEQHFIYFIRCIYDTRNCSGVPDACVPQQQAALVGFFGVFSFFLLSGAVSFSRGVKDINILLHYCVVHTESKREYRSRAAGLCTETYGAFFCSCLGIWATFPDLRCMPSGFLRVALLVLVGQVARFTDKCGMHTEYSKVCSNCHHKRGTL